MKLENLNKELIQKLYDVDKTLIVATLIPYKNNTKIKAYTSSIEDYYPSEPVGDIPDEEFENYINEDNVVLFIKRFVNDDTGMPEMFVGTMEETVN